MSNHGSFPRSGEKREAFDDKSSPVLFGTWVLTCIYTNWRGETAPRLLGPMRIWFGSTEWHPEPQWLMEAMDLDKTEVRQFAMKDMRDVQMCRTDAP